jgi:hypothetical protein
MLPFLASMFNETDSTKLINLLIYYNNLTNVYSVDEIQIPKSS